MQKQKILMGICAICCLAMLLSCTLPAQAAQVQLPDDPMVLSADHLDFSGIGEEKTLSVEGVDPEELFWSSDDQAVAMVAEGSVVATGAGETNIRVYNFFDGRESVCRVTSSPDPEATPGTIRSVFYQQPLIRPPLPARDVTDYFGDVIIMGDSTGYALFQWEKLHGQMGDVVFLTRGGVSINSLILGSRKYFYRNQEYRVEDAVAVTGRKKLYVMLGANDIPQFGVDRTLELFDELLTKILKKTPDLQLYIESVTPVWTEAEYPGLTNEEFDAFNAKLETYCQEKGYHYINIAPYFKDSTNGFARSYCADFLIHANYKGGGMWVQLLKSYIAENEMEG